jgi:hypothetical protein
MVAVLEVAAPGSRSQTAEAPPLGTAPACHYSSGRRTYLYVGKAADEA